jgi:hypothetical protein
VCLRVCMTVCVCVPAAGGVSVGLMCGRTLMTGKRSKSVCVCLSVCFVCVCVRLCVCVVDTRVPSIKYV